MTDYKILGEVAETKFDLGGSEALFISYGVDCDSDTYAATVVTTSSVKPNSDKTPGAFNKTDPGYKRLEISVYLGQYDTQIRPRLDEANLDPDAFAEELVGQGLKTGIGKTENTELNKDPRKISTPRRTADP